MLILREDRLTNWKDGTPLPREAAMLTRAEMKIAQLRTADPGVD